LWKRSGDSKRTRKYSEKEKLNVKQKEEEEEEEEHEKKEEASMPPPQAL